MKLTRCERAVLDLVAEGYQTKEIARRLHRSVSTIKTQLAAASDKLHARNRAHAAVLFRDDRRKP